MSILHYKRLILMIGRGIKSNNCTKRPSGHHFWLLLYVYTTKTVRAVWKYATVNKRSMRQTFCCLTAGQIKNHTKQINENKNKWPFEIQTLKPASQ